MVTVLKRVVVESEGMTVSKLVWRTFRARMPGVVEATLSLKENRGLASLGPELPVGTVVFLPFVSPRPSEERATVRLW